MESAWTPKSSHAWSTTLIARTPARWPKLAGRPRPRAQRPLPSMMIPMWRGIGESKGGESVPTGAKASLGEPLRRLRRHLPMNGEDMRRHLPMNREDLRRHLPMNGEDMRRHLPMNGEDMQRHLPMNGEDLRRHLPMNGEDASSRLDLHYL